MGHGKWLCVLWGFFPDFLHIFVFPLVLIASDDESRDSIYDTFVFAEWTIH